MQVPQPVALENVPSKQGIQSMLPATSHNYSAARGSYNGIPPYISGALWVLQTVERVDALNSNSSILGA